MNKILPQKFKGAFAPLVAAANRYEFILKIYYVILQRSSSIVVAAWKLIF